MAGAKEHRSAPVSSDPVPCTSSDENISKAQAIREELRRKLLDERPQQNGPYQVISAD
jgi:hypothetical protein